MENSWEATGASVAAADIEVRKPAGFFFVHLSVRNLRNFDHAHALHDLHSDSSFGLADFEAQRVQSRASFWRYLVVAFRNGSHAALFAALAAIVGHWHLTRCDSSRLGLSFRRHDDLNLSICLVWNSPHVLPPLETASCGRNFGQRLMRFEKAEAKLRSKSKGFDPRDSTEGPGVVPKEDSANLELQWHPAAPLGIDPDILCHFHRNMVSLWATRNASGPAGSHCWFALPAFSCAHSAP